MDSLCRVFWSVRRVTPRPWDDLSESNNLAAGVAQLHRACQRLERFMFEVLSPPEATLQDVSIRGLPMVSCHRCNREATLWEAEGRATTLSRTHLIFETTVARLLTRTFGNKAHAVATVPVIFLGGWGPNLL